MLWFRIMALITEFIGWLRVVEMDWLSESCRRSKLEQRSNDKIRDLMNVKETVIDII